MKTIKTVSIVVLIFLVSCGPAEIISVQAPTMQISATPTPIPTGIIPTRILQPTPFLRNWDLCKASPINCISAIAIDGDGNLWAASRFGVVYWDLISGQFIYAELIDHAVFDASQNTMNSIAIAGDGTVFAGGYYEKIFAFRNGKWVRELTTDKLGYNISLFVQPDGSVFLSGMFSQRIYRYRDGGWSSDAIPSVFSCGIAEITSDSKGILWAVDEGCPKSRSYLRKFDDSEWVQEGNYSPSQLIFNDETIWFTDFSGNEDEVCQIITSSLIDCFVVPGGRMGYSGIMFGKKDEVWIRSAADNLIWHLDHEKWAKADFPVETGDYISSIYMTSDGIMYIGTYGQGIVRDDGKSIKRYIINYIPSE